MHPSSDTGKAILHWSQWLWPGPRRVFSAQEMARAGAQPWPKAINHYVLANVITLLAINYAEIPSGLAPGLAAGALLLTLLSLWVAQQLWAQPTRLRLNLYTLAAGLGLVGCALGLRWLLGREAAQVHLLSYAAIVLVSCSAWWMLSLMRVQQIEARLRELDDQAQQARLARRLATAQIQPHFLFNTLASLQHWVDTRDPRAGSTLRAFTQYLRATLPMFERESHSLAQELQIVRSYLEIMQARLGGAWCGPCRRRQR
ncbi:histidine kinase [Kinneretia asaccharophila]|nr:histidine kinase [Roseateles asaccharophilus]MDN3542971.1 histidine kinase [Roseateles asaccharophilus]